jgi:hypothetical protein
MALEACCQIVFKSEIPKPSTEGFVTHMQVAQGLDGVPVTESHMKKVC